MAICEVCDESHGYRKKTNGKMACSLCRHYMMHPEEAARDYRRLCDEKLKIQKELHDIQGPIRDPFSAIPPRDVLLKAKIALDLDGGYGVFSKVLAHYFKIDAPEYQVSPERVPEGAIACYFPEENKVCSGKTMSLKTAFHEFFHALEEKRIVKWWPKNESEKNANLFAQGCIRLLKISSFTLD